MIPFHYALIAWIPIAALCMADRNAARGLSCAFLGAWLFLPAGQEFDLIGLPGLSKFMAPTLGVLAGTILFHPKSFDNFKLGVPDLILVGILQLEFASAIMNDRGLYAAMSRSLEFGTAYILPVFLVRLHLSTPRALRTFMVAFVFAAIMYTPLAMWEFRMSPQLHSNAYGYFQHQFVQHSRYGMWRPAVFFDHALMLGRFFAIAAFLALFPLRRDLMSMAGKYFGPWLFVIPLIGLFVSLSAGPYLLFMLLCAAYVAIMRRQIWIAFAAPVAALVWLVCTFSGLRPGFFLANEILRVNPDRGESLWYRLYALEEYGQVILSKPWFGHGRFGAGRIENLATDSQALMNGLKMGMFGAGVLYLWWFVAMYYSARVIEMTRDTRMARRAAAVVTLCSLSLVVSVLDRGLDPTVLTMIASTTGIYGWLMSRSWAGEHRVGGRLPGRPVRAAKSDQVA